MSVNTWIYNRTMSVHREAPEGAVGGGGDDDYGGTDRGGEVVLAADVPCSIQHNSTGAQSQADLPGGAASRGRYRIHVPIGQIANGLVHRSDIIVDDEGVRYIVNAPYRHPMGWRIECDMAEV